MKTNQELKNEALASLKGNWGAAILAFFVYLVVASVLSVGMESSSIATAVSGNPATTALEFVSLGLSVIVIFGVFPLAVGFYNAFRILLDSGDTDLTGNMFRIGFKNYLHNVWGYLAMTIKIVLWTLLFIIPGIIMSFAYVLTPYILADNPELSGWEASTLSRKMMKGHKFRCFCLYLSFIGWILLCILTLGIGVLWLEPYMLGTFAAFYNDVKVEYTAH